jgi:hypothetical protein
MDLAELEKIERGWDEYWGKVSKEHPETFKKVKRIIPNQICRAAPIKFHILLKCKYNKARNFKNEKTGYVGNRCQISDTELNIALGNIDFEIARALQASHCVRKREKSNGLSETFEQSRGSVLSGIFYVAKKLKWIVSFPEYDEKKQAWEFNFNASYFAPEAKVANLKICCKNN